MKQQAYPTHGVTSKTQILGYEADNPKKTCNYPALGFVTPFIPNTAKQFFGLITQSGPTLGPNLIPATGTENQIGEILDSVRDSAGNYTITFPVNTFLTGTLYVLIGVNGGPVTPKVTQVFVDSFDPDKSKLIVSNYDLSTDSYIDGINTTLHLILI